MAQAFRDALNSQELTFVDEYVTDFNGTRSAIAAGYSAHTATVQASRLLTRPKIKEEIERRLKAAAKVNALTVKDLVDELTLIVKADPRDLVEYRRGACRYCHGDGFEYQRTPAEYRRDFQAYQASKQGKLDPVGINFPILGGVGFNPHREPHPECPECHGEGVGYSHPKDSRKLPRAAARLFAGVKETKEGLEIKTRNVDKLTELAMKHLGMLAERMPGEGENDQAQPVTVVFEVSSARKPAE